MAKKAKAESNVMLGSADRITVTHEGNEYLVNHDFSKTLYQKMELLRDGKAGAQFSKEEGCWRVPEASADNLAMIVENMRDFNRNNGVQVTNAKNGDKYIQFDRWQQLKTLAGGIADAKFDKDARAWIVPASSKALVEKEGGSSYFDYAVDQMRTINKAFEENEVKIKAYAAEYAQSKGMNPGIVFGQAGKSYQGAIIQANANFAAQATDIDEVNGVAYVAIHNMDNFPKPLMKDPAQSMYIAYNDLGEVNVRTIEVFKQQQVEREALTQVAMNKMDGANVRNASYQDGKKYEGEVIEVGKDKHLALQSNGRNNFTIHRLDKLSASIKKGDQISINCKNGIGQVIDLSKKKEAVVER